MAMVKVEGPGDDAVALVTLDRPERKNALSIALRDEVVEVLDRLAADESVKAGGFTGAGVVFSAGFDFGEFEQPELVAATTARFSHPEITFGDVVYGPLHDLVGGAVARELCLTGRNVDAREALALRLVSAVVEPAEVVAAARTVAADVTKAPRQVLLRTKAKIVRRSGVVVGETLDL